MSNKPDISVLALGNWGTALANHLANSGYNTLGWAIESQIVEGINNQNKNPLFQSETPLSKNLKATQDLDEALKAKYVVMVFPSKVLGLVVPKLKASADTIFISAIKGLHDETLMTPLQYAKQHMPQKNNLAVLSGPSFAKDVVRGRPTSVVVASAKEEIANEVAGLFHNDTLRIYSSTDTLGVELGGVAKNVIALAAGACDGIGLGDSARSALITRGLAEITRLAVAMGAKPETLFGLSGLGDLVLTATCDNSRNRTVGLRLGKGESLDHITKTLGSVAEGVRTAPLLLKLADKHNVEMPITSAVSAVIDGEVSCEQMVERLMSRPQRTE